MTGFETAMNEITLVLFTTLAPSGVVAYCLMAAVLLRSDGQRAKRLGAMLLMPFLVCLAGLVASATHLGNPDNALYVFAGIGRSPLSTEVAAAVVFLGAAGLQWLYQFAEHARSWLQKALLVVAVVAGAGFLAAVAMAYSSRTVVTWCTPLVPMALVLNALVGGPLLAQVGFACAKVRLGRSALALPIASSGALAANVVIYIAQARESEGLANGVVSVAQLAPGYEAAIWVFAALCLSGIVLDAVVVLRALRSCPTQDRSREGEAASCALPLDDASEPGISRRALAGTVTATLLVLAGIFTMRFMFYMTHMTVGISL